VVKAPGFSPLRTHPTNPFQTRALMTDGCLPLWGGLYAPCAWAGYCSQ
jgi:hypothetical protein